MALVRVKVIDRSNLGKVPAALNVQNQHIQAALRQSVSIYSAAMRRRFNIYSRGGGDWAPLALVTTSRRRRGGKKKGGVDFGGGRNR